MGSLVHVGCGGKPFPGWVNIDPLYHDHPDVLPGDATHLPCADKSADLVFSNATFEHLFLAHLIPALREAARVVNDTGLIAAIGIPDFARVAYLYVCEAPGITDRRFDLFEAYRYCHGWAEGDTLATDWQAWDVSGTPDTAPTGWLPQAHKSLFDSDFLHALCDQAKLERCVFTYAYPGEPPLNLGLLAHPSRTPSIDDLHSIPNVGQWVVANSVNVVAQQSESRMCHFADWATQGHPLDAIPAQGWA